MTNPVILLGTQSNGETLPVQVDATGRLVAEGLRGTEGPPGPEGPQGPEGPPGPGGIELPPDPYEGALLGWLNGELSWIGTPPVPIPDNVYGPITSWDSENGLLSIDGIYPETIGNGVYLYQCDERGDFYTEDWNVTQTWSRGTVTSGDAALMFNGDNSGGSNWSSADQEATFTFAEPIPFNKIELLCSRNVHAVSAKIKINNNIMTGVPAATGPGDMADFTSQVSSPLTSLGITRDGAHGAYITAVFVDGMQLVDTDYSVNMRVNQRFSDNTVIGVSHPEGVDFTVGKYVRAPDQRVAPWLLYGNDPTSLIDHLRKTRD